MNILINFILTFLIELIIFYIFLRRDYIKTAGYVLLINLFSWPLANLFYNSFNHLLVVELGVFIVEGFLIMLLFEFSWKKSFLLSLVANFISAFVGLLI